MDFYESTNERQDHLLPKITNQGLELMPGITPYEVKTTLLETKNNKSPGDDGVVIEAIKLAHNLFHSGVEMDSQQQQFCLKWNSFGSNLATSFSNLFKSETLADVTLFCDGVTFKAHKLILAACSKHLADLFETAPLHQNLLVILDNTSATNMSALLEFMYKGEVHVSQDSLSSFLKAAECLQVKGLSIEHEKLAVAQSHNITPMDSGTDSPGKHIK
ncbi:longitudinals lacking protein-like, partial [Diabrotica undecimpunctata]|uniref:longitudinals lacking protein-like n=1 Tax=Diabrotica undecimpunctata TaxID=50387 RepID=UPI003B63A563